MQIKRFIFNSFQENTYLLYDNTMECAIVDAGCNTVSEVEVLDDYITKMRLNPTLLLNTHTHIDHILGNKYMYDKYGLIPHFHAEDLFLYQSSKEIARMYDLKYSFLAPPYKYIEENQKITFGKSVLNCILVPGHSPGSICFYNNESQMLISGDVLFRESIGRTDLPGGNHQQLLANISEKLLTLPNEVLVFPGHMESTTIGHEKEYNPFF